MISVYVSSLLYQAKNLWYLERAGELFELEERAVNQRTNIVRARLVEHAFLEIVLNFGDFRFQAFLSPAAGNANH